VAECMEWLQTGRPRFDSRDMQRFLPKTSVGTHRASFNLCTEDFFARDKGSGGLSRPFILLFCAGIKNAWSLPYCPMRLHVVVLYTQGRIHL
jgi:hypothetical protein